MLWGRRLVSLEAVWSSSSRQCIGCVLCKTVQAALLDVTTRLHVGVVGCLSTHLHLSMHGLRTYTLLFPSYDRGFDANHSCFTHH